MPAPAVRRATLYLCRAALLELRCDAPRRAAPRRARAAPRRSDIACCHVDATLTPIRTMAIASRMALAEFLTIFFGIGKGERLRL